MATLLHDPKIQEYAILALQEPWRSPFISTCHNPILHFFCLRSPKDNRESSSSLIHLYVFLSFKVPLPPCPQSQSSCHWTLTGNTPLSPYYIIPHPPCERPNRTVDPGMQVGYLVALGRSVICLVRGFSLKILVPIVFCVCVCLCQGMQAEGETQYSDDRGCNN